jgi:hypothetical protein
MGIPLPAGGADGATALRGVSASSVRAAISVTGGIVSTPTFMKV